MHIQAYWIGGGSFRKEFIDMRLIGVYYNFAEKLVLEKLGLGSLTEAHNSTATELH